MTEPTDKEAAMQSQDQANTPVEEAKTDAAAAPAGDDAQAGGAISEAEKKRLQLFEWFQPVEDPELFVSIVDLGLIYDINLHEGKCLIRMTLTSPGCPMGDYIIETLRQRGLEHEDIKEVDVDIVWEPRWDPHTMASEEAKDQLGIW